MEHLKLFAGDLEIETLKMIKRDLTKYSHLAAYKKMYKELCLYIAVREDDERRKKRA